MRPDIPWNVAGIPIEAREAARAAARREGLSVGEWMTRRILRSFSDAAEAAPMREAWSSNVSSFTAATEVRPSRRDTEEMLAHVARSETESSEVFRRIEEQLRGVARRLEAAERSQSENNRAMTKAASEINITAREQAQAFDQLGNNIISLADRLDRVERQGASEGLREAVKGLHQGLSRLADQISATATQSATQISALAGNVESVAGRVGEVRAEADNTNQAVDQRLTHFDERIRVLENLVQSGQAAVERALASLEVRAEQDAAANKRDSDAASAISRLEDGLAKLSAPAADPVLDTRLSGIERTLGEIAGRLDQPDKQFDTIEDELKRLAQRIEASEAGQQDSVAQLRAELSAVSRPAAEATHAPVIEVVEHVVAQPAVAVEEPSFVNVLAPDVVVPHEEQSGQFSTFEAAPAVESAPLAEEDLPAEPEHDQSESEADPFAAEAVEPPPVESSAPAAPDSYLAAARRSARAAAAQAESDIGSRIGGFSWGAISADDEARSDARKTYFVVAIIALVLILAIAAGAFLSQRIGTASPRSTVPLIHPQKAAANGVVTRHEPARMTTSTAPSLNTVVVPATQGAAASTNPTAGGVAPATSPARSASITPLDKLTALANSGNAKAELIVGLKYLDGDGVAVSEVDAAKWLSRAALAGQPVAEYRLGTLYERGRGVAADPSKSVHWYMLAAQAGNRKAMHNLAVAYASGTGVAKNLPEAARWFARAAALGLSDSQFNLAVLYERGLGVPQSLVDAYKWYAIAAAAGDTESKARIDALATQLSSEDRAAAQRSVDAFRPQPLDPNANVPPQLGEIAN